MPSNLIKVVKVEIKKKMALLSPYKGGNNKVHVDSYLIVLKIIRPKEAYYLFSSYFVM